MSEKEFVLRVVTPEKLFIDNLPVTLVEARGAEGAFGAMPGHEPFLTALQPGPVSYKAKGAAEKDDFHCEGGVIEVLPNKVTVLAESAVKYTQEDLDRAEREEAERQEELRKELEAMKAERAKACAADKKKAAEEKAEYDKKLAEYQAAAAAGKEMTLELPEGRDQEEDEITRLEIKLTKSVSRTSYIQSKKLTRIRK